MLLLIILSAAAATMVVTGASLHRETTRFAMGKRGEVEAIARVFASATAEAVINQQRGEALRVLRAMGRIPGVQYSGIENSNGQMLAELGLNVRLQDDIDAKPDGLSLFDLLSQRSITVSVPITSADEEIGRLILVSDASELWTRVETSLIDAGLAALIAMIVGFLLVIQVQRSIAGRIGTITAGMQHIRLRHDYTKRIDAVGGDELDTIATGFNAMLDEIALRDERLSAHRENLENEVSERTADLRRAVESADAANAAKSDFLATMSHEIRTPMNGILVMAELLAASELKPKQKRFADVIARSGGSLLAIINDILDFSKIEAGKIELEVIPCAVDELVETVAQLFEERARSKALDLSCHIAANLPARLGADPVRLNQIIANLVNNALKFTEAGSVNIMVSRDPARAGYWLIAVEDTGIGIAQDKADTIFEAFSQADQTTTRRFGGTGLGLAITKRLVEAMQGTIWVKSALGEGTTFFVSLPLVPVDRLEREAPGAMRIGSGKALIAVSGGATRANLTQYLHDFGFDVADAINDTLGNTAGETTLIIADAALLDDPFTARLLAHAPIIALGTFGSADIDRVVECGTAQAQLIKPLSRRDLRQAILDIRSGTIRKREVAAPAPASFAQYSNRLVLVADDNPVNREVIIETLRRFDLPCDTVGDGRAAIEAVQAKTYDLVFMDGSMPEIDGFEATARIRALEQESGTHLPIVALTAHVVGTHADAWKRAGMDGILHKPFTLQAMAQILETHLATRPARLAAPLAPTAWPIPVPPAPELPGFAASPAAEAPEDPVLDPRTTSQLVEMSRQGGSVAVQRIYALYLENGPISLAEIGAAIAAGESDALARAAHALKSMSLSIGARHVAILAGELEKEARSDVSKSWARVHGDISTALDQAYASMQTLLATMEADQPDRERHARAHA